MTCSILMELEEIAKQISTCTKCPLNESRANTVPGEGNPDAELMFIGEGPGRVEDEQGRPFVGPAGKLLEELLGTIDLGRNDVYIGNVIKCRPPGNRDPLPDEASACWPYLREQIKSINPKIIILLGRHAMERFIPNKKISEVRGKPLRRDIQGIGKLIFYPIFHPAAALHQERFMEPLKVDFRRIPRVIEKVDEMLSKEEKGEEENPFEDKPEGPEQAKLL